MSFPRFVSSMPQLLDALGLPVAADACVHFSAGVDRHPLHLLAPGALAGALEVPSPDARLVPSPALHVRIDRTSFPQRRIVDADETGCIRTVAEPRPINIAGIAGYIGRIAVEGPTGDAPPYEPFVLSIRGLNEVVAPALFSVGLRAPIAIGVRDGCLGFGGNTREACVTRMSPEGRAFSGAMGIEHIRWWFLDHLADIDVPRTIAPGQIYRGPGDPAVSLEAISPVLVDPAWGSKGVHYRHDKCFFGGTWLFRRQPVAAFARVLEAWPRLAMWEGRSWE